MEYYHVAKRAAFAGGEILKKYWGHLTQVSQKAYAGDLVTEADRESEQAILAIIREHFPLHTILSEESGFQEVKESEFLWVVDPLDGTTNYTHQYPMVCVTLALLQKGKLLCGITYDPFRNEWFHAIHQGGAFLNEKPIHVSKEPLLSHALLATGFAYDRRENPETNYAQFCHLTHITQGVRRSGSAGLDLAYVAAGRLDGFWERGLKPWDVAAGILLIEEAGGTVTDYQLQPVTLDRGYILATNSHLHQALHQELG